MKNMEEKFDSENLINNYGNIIYRIALNFLQNKEDAEDIVQNVFMKYIAFIKSGKQFNDKEHEKSWIIRVTMNDCYNEKNSARKKYNVPLVEDYILNSNLETESSINDIIKKLDDKYKIVLKLFYLNDLKIAEIGQILHLTESNVKTRLKRARNYIKENLRKEEFNG